MILERPLVPELQPQPLNLVLTSAQGSRSMAFCTKRITRRPIIKSELFLWEMRTEKWCYALKGAWFLPRVENQEHIPTLTCSEWIHNTDNERQKEIKICVSSRCDFSLTERGMCVFFHHVYIVYQTAPQTLLLEWLLRGRAYLCMVFLDFHSSAFIPVVGTLFPGVSPCLASGLLHLWDFFPLVSLVEFFLYLWGLHVFELVKVLDVFFFLSMSMIRARLSLPTMLAGKCQ